MTTNFYYKSEPNLLDQTVSGSSVSGVGSFQPEFPSVFDRPDQLAGKKTFSTAYAGRKTPKSRSLSSGSLLVANNGVAVPYEPEVKFSNAYVGGTPKKPKSSVPTSLSTNVEFSTNYIGDEEVVPTDRYILDTYRPEGSKPKKERKKLRAEKIVKFLVAVEFLTAAYIFLSSLTCALITYYRKEPWLYSDVCIRASGLWVGSICLINAFVGIAVLCRSHSKPLMFVYMTTSIIAALVSGVEVIMSAYSTWRVATDPSNLPGNYGGDADALRLVDSYLVVNSVVCLAAFCSAALCCASVSLMCCSSGCCCEQAVRRSEPQMVQPPQPQGQQLVLHYVVPNSSGQVQTVFSPTYAQ